MARGQRGATRVARQMRRIKVPLPPKPKVRDLKSALAGVVSVSIEVRIQAMTQALSWYDLAIDYMMKKSQNEIALAVILRDRLKYITRGNKARELGVNRGASLPERETALRTALKQFELYCPELKPVSVEAYFDKYSVAKDALELKEKEAAARYAVMVQALEEALPNAGVRFRVSSEVTGRKFDGEGTMLYGKTVAKNMLLTLKREGILKMISSELMAVSMVMALSDDGNGNMNIVDRKRQVLAMDSLVKDFVAFCQSSNAPKRVIKPAPAIAQRASVPQPNSNQPRKPRKPSVGGQGKVGGRYKKGSIIGALYERMANEQEWLKADLFAGFDKCEGGRTAPFNRLLLHVQKFGEFDIDVNGDKVRMTLNKGGA